MPHNETNNPWKDNWERAHQKRLKITGKQLRVRNNDGSRIPRKHKKMVHLAERKNYEELVDIVFRDKISNYPNYYLLFPVKI